MFCLRLSSDALVCDAEVWEPVLRSSLYFLRLRLGHSVLRHFIEALVAPMRRPHSMRCTVQCMFR